LGFRDSFGDQVGHRIVVVGPLDPRWCGFSGFELLDDAFGGLVGGAAQLRCEPGMTRLVDREK
jgi:hypothetical protein